MPITIHYKIVFQGAIDAMISFKKGLARVLICLFLASIGWRIDSSATAVDAIIDVGNKTRFLLSMKDTSITNIGLAPCLSQGLQLLFATSETRPHRVTLANSITNTIRLDNLDRALLTHRDSRASRHNEWAIEIPTGLHVMRDATAFANTEASLVGWMRLTLLNVSPMLTYAWKECLITNDCALGARSARAIVVQLPC